MFDYSTLGQALDEQSAEKLFPNEETRLLAVRTGRQLLAKAQTPWEQTERHALVNPFYNSVLKTLTDLKLFSLWQGAGWEPKTILQLSELVGADPILIGRLIRFMVGMYHLEERGEDAYAPTTFSKTLARPEIVASYAQMFDTILPSARMLPEFLAQQHYRNPEDSKNTAFMATTGAPRDMHVFEWLASKPKIMNDFTLFMTAYAATRSLWFDIFPIYKALPETVKKDEVTLVDVGGSHGQDLERLLTRHGSLLGRLILEDQPHVVESAKVSAAIEPIGYDFFTPQPVKGARFYYMHSIIHDWPKAAAQAILRNQAAAMQQGFSRLLIHDHVIPLRGPSATAAGYDITMMATGGATERTLPMWEELLKDSGLKVVKVWQLPESTDSIIEAEIA